MFAIKKCSTWRGIAKPSCSLFASNSSSTVSFSHDSNNSCYYGWNQETNPVPQKAPWLNQTRVEWPGRKSLDGWLDTTGQSLDVIKRDFNLKGYAVLRGFVSENELDVYRRMHDDMQSGKLQTPGRHDLGSHKEQKVPGKENVGQIMWPTDLVENSRHGPIHHYGYEISKFLLGGEDPWAFDFDMLIFKPERSDTETPWHQDEAYWPAGIADKRAITFWVALDDARVENGAMWYVEESHKWELMEHKPAAAGSHILMTEAVSEDTEGATPIELDAGDVVLWHGRTLHYSRGNTTDRPRRTFIVNFRPEKMVAWQRKNGFDHLRKGFDDYENQKQSAGNAYKQQE